MNMNHTHRTTIDVLVDPPQSQTRVFPYTAAPRLIPAGTTGTIEFHGIVGGAPCVTFIGGGMEVNIAHPSVNYVERIKEPV